MYVDFSVTETNANFSDKTITINTNFILDKTPVITPVIKDTWEGAKEIYSSSNFEESIRILFEKNII